MSFFHSAPKEIEVGMNKPFTTDSLNLTPSSKAFPDTYIRQPNFSSYPE